MHKFLQTLDGNVYRKLSEIAEQRGISIQELLRAVVIPEWMRFTSQKHAQKVGPRRREPRMSLTHANRQALSDVLPKDS